jgi:predicted nucleic acid-binding protein
MALVDYFDSNVWISLFYGETQTEKVEALIKEIKADKGVIITSIITLTEITIHAHKKDPSKVRIFQQTLSDLSSICNITEEIAILAAKIEALFGESVWTTTEAKKSRRWDAYHLSTAAANHASIFYTADTRLQRSDFSAEPRIPPIKPPLPTLPIQPKLI